MNDPVHREKVSLGIKNAFKTMSSEKRNAMSSKLSTAIRGKPSPVRGSKSPRTKLVEDDVRQIRCEFAELIQIQTQTQVCRSLMLKYDVGYNTIYKIVTCATWKHVKV